MKKAIALLFSLSTLTVPGFAYATEATAHLEQKIETKEFSQQQIAEIDQLADRVWVETGGDIDKVKQFYESKGVKHIKRETKMMTSNSLDSSIGVQGGVTNPAYTITMDFYRTSAYYVKVIANVSISSDYTWESTPGSLDKLVVAWDKDIQFRSSDTYNFLTYRGNNKSNFAANEIMTLAKAQPDAIAYSVKDGLINLGTLNGSDFVTKAYCNITLGDPKNAIGTGPWTTYYADYLHTYGSTSTALGWSIGFPSGITVTNSSTTTENYKEYGSYLNQYGP